MTSSDSTTTQAPAAVSGDDASDASAHGVRVNSYDQIPYSVGAFPQTHPDRLATIASLFAMRPADPRHCRVLELGCASGGNLIPMAAAAPESRFVGIDLSQRQIADGQAMVRELSLANLDLHHLSILDVTPELGSFDYILCHGVYSWVPPQVQEKILEICSRNLASQGVAYISYNAYPGWYARGAIREMLWYHTQTFEDPAQRIKQARALLAFMAASTRNDDGGYSTLLRQELALLTRVPDSYLLHEHLEEYNEPLYFHQFAQRAAEKGLQYLGEAQISSMVAARFGAEVEKTLRKISPDLLHMEQYMDFLRNRMFRQTLLCHADIELDFNLRADAVQRFRIASSARPASPDPGVATDGPEVFQGPGTLTLTTSDPLMKAAMTHLGKIWPASAAFDELLVEARARCGRSTPEDQRQLSSRLLNCYASGLVELSIAPPAFTTTVSERPVAAPYVRLRADRGNRVTNMRLEGVTLGDPSRAVLRHLDGRHTRDDLLQLVLAWMKDQPAAKPAAEAAPYLDQLLPAFAGAALLVG